jgi:hypothetical protein
MKHAFEKIQISYIGDTIYTLFVYNSYLIGSGIIDFDERTINMLFDSYLLSDILEIVEIVDLCEQAEIDKKRTEAKARGRDDYEEEEKPSLVRSKFDGSESPHGIDHSFSQPYGGSKSTRKKRAIKKKNKTKKRKIKNNKKTKKHSRKYKKMSLKK